MNVGAGVKALALVFAAVLVVLGLAAPANAAPLPKFSVTAVSDPPANAEPGDTFEVTGTVQQLRAQGREGDSESQPALG